MVKNALEMEERAKSQGMRVVSRNWKRQGNSYLGHPKMMSC
jgi:hypothetical protein